MSSAQNEVVARNVATVRAMFDAVATRGDPADFAQRWAAYAARYNPDAVIHESPSLPYGGEYSGMTGVAAHAQAYGAAWAPFQDLELQDLNPTFVAEDDKVVVLWRQRGRNPDTGATFDMPATSVYRMRDGRVAESRMFHYDVALVRDFLAGTGGK